jgi:hypothetical protein
MMIPLANEQGSQSESVSVNCFHLKHQQIVFEVSNREKDRHIGERETVI